MPLTEAGDRPDNPIYVLFNAQAVGAGATVNSPSVDTGRYQLATLVVTVDQTHDVNPQVSDDDVTFANLQNGGLNASGIILAGGAAGTRAWAIHLGAARYFRVSIRNTSGAGGTVSAKVMLR